MLDRISVSRDRRAMYNANKLKIGMFGANCSSGRSVTLVPERWSGNWADCLRLAQMADEAGIDFMLPVARWKSYSDKSDYQGTTLETMNWASGLLASTKRITVFGTIHAPLFHPVMAAKEFVTADHIGQGRFGLNVVAGWNEDEFEMFGVKQLDHEERYVYVQEWIDTIMMMWSDMDGFDFDGKYIKLKDVYARPKPYGGTRPLIMNAGASSTGLAFAIRNCDAFFTQASKDVPEETARHVKMVKDEAKTKHNREIGVFTVGVVTCRPTMKEAQEYHHHCVVENADWEAVDAILAKRKITPESVGAEEFKRQRLHTANGMGGLPMIGDPDYVASQLAGLSAAGLDGIGISLLNYAAELPYLCDEVLPRLERLGLRQKVR